LIRSAIFRVAIATSPGTSCNSAAKSSPPT
jgi:hypothetical protein